MNLGIKLDYNANSMDLSPITDQKIKKSKYLAVGCINGSVLIIDPMSLIVTY